MILGRLTAITIAVAIAGAPFSVAAQDVGVSVSVNGTTLVFDQPPVELEGRIFVPLRGLFERLGASVVFDAGRIAITSGAHTIGLHVGETLATIDGQPQTLDAPPLVIGGRTLVPLRFIAQALGAKVVFDDTTRIVSITGAPITSATPAVVSAPLPLASMAPPTTPAATPAPSVGATAKFPLGKGEIPIGLRLLRIEPAPNATLARKRPEISATFAESVDPTSIHVSLDGGDVTADTTPEARSFTTDPSVDVPAGAHTVVVTGRTPDKERFEEHWSFTTTDAANANFVSGLEPTGGSMLGSTTFEISGFTRPKARVRIVATTSATSSAFSDTSDGSSTVDVVASAKGYFEAPLSLVDHGSGLIDVRIASTAPDGGRAVRTLRLRL